MLSGLEVLGSFDELARQSAGESQAVDREVAGLTEQLVKLRERQAETYRALARLRVGDLTDDVLQRDLDAAERQARRLLEERATASQALEAKLGEAAADLADLAKRQAELAEEQERLAESAEAAEAEALKQLAETQTYKTQRARAEEAEKIARHAEEKTGFAKQDRLTKGQPYEDDPLFMYLWRRGFGTAAYEAGFLARYFDRRVARLISFEKARANYAMLLEIPKRLEAHAQRQRKIAEAEAQSLDDLEESAVESGTAQERRRHLAEARRRLADLEEKLAALAAKRADLLEQRGLLTRGDDRLTREALELIETALKRRDLRALREQALRTPLPDDDALVDRLRDLEAEASDIGKLLEARKAIQQEQQRRPA